MRRAGFWGQVGGCEVGWGGQAGCRCRPLVAPRAWDPYPGVSPRGDECCWEAEGCLAASPAVIASMCACACLSEAQRGGQPRTPPPSANAGRKPEPRDGDARPGADALLPAGQAPPGRALSSCPPPEGATPAQVLAERERCGGALPSVWTRWASGGSS